MSNNPKEGPFIIAPSEFYICFVLITDLSLTEGPFSLKTVYCVAEVLNARVSGCVFLSV